MTGVADDQLLMQGVDPLQGKRFPVRKRDGRIAVFNEARIYLAIESAFKAQQGVGPDKPLPALARAAVKLCADAVVQRVLARAVHGEELEVESIQDAVEEQLMVAGHLEVARRYILYREERRRARMERERQAPREGRRPAGGDVSVAGRAAARGGLTAEKLDEVFRRQFEACINEGEYWRLLTPDLLDFDTAWLARGLRPERDEPFDAAGLEALRGRYLLRANGRLLETPQYFWMRIAMGLALNEEGYREGHALEFYEALSTLRFIPSDAILRQAGAPRPFLGGLDSNPGADMATGPLGAINLGVHLLQPEPQLDVARLRQTVALAVRLLDNAVDLTLYPTEEARAGGLENRAIGLGLAGLERALEKLHIDAGSADAAAFGERSADLVSCLAVTASAELAGERGAFPGYAQSDWSCGVLPIDTTTEDWEAVRVLIRRQGIRNGTITAGVSSDSSAILAGTVSAGESGATESKAGAVPAGATLA
jgi:ribonucleotide reductase alpha subunit